MLRKNTILRTLFIILVITVILLISRNASESVNSTITIITAILGFFAILYQLSNDHKIKRAEFLYSLNDSFNNDKKIMSTYDKLKKNRIEKQTFSIDDLNDTGSYIMFFIIMNYLVNKGQVTIGMVDKIFANKFFLLCHTECIQEKQLSKKQIDINYPIMELYKTWFNYRQVNGLCKLYESQKVYALHTDIYKMEKGLITFKHIKKPKLVFYKNKLLKRINNEKSFK